MTATTLSCAALQSSRLIYTMWWSAMRGFFRSKCWYRILLLVCFGTLVEVAPTSQQDGSISRATIPMDPAAAKVFPSAQFSPACAIINIEGLGPLDGDYALVDELTETNGTPAWTGTSAGNRRRVLSWQTAERVWAIGEYGLSVPIFRAVVRGTSNNVPPSRSSRWQLYSKSTFLFEEVENVVSISCPACAAVAISMLPGALAACEGPYRLRTANHKAGLLSWSHVNDERCEMVHDKSGHAWVAFANPTATDGSDAAYGVPRAEYWLLRAAEERIAGSAGDRAKVVCTSAGRTTRLVLGLVESREGIDSREGIGSPRANHDSGDAQSFGPSSGNVRFVSPQDGSIICATHRNIHLRITRDEELRRRQSDASGARLADENENSCGTTLCVKITANGIEVLTTSLERMTIQGMLQPLHGLEGTNVFELCLFEQDTGDAGDTRLENKRQGCIARTVLALEMFSAETQMVQRRSSSETVRTPSVMSSGVEVEKDGAEEGTRVLFLVDLAVVDGFKLSTLHLMKHLPDTFRASTLDLSCASGDLPMREILTKEVGDVKRICLKFLMETWDTGVRENGTMPSFLNSVLSKARTWEDVVSGRPDVAQALGDLYRHLDGFDALVMSNGGIDADAYLLHLARIAGVKTRMVNLGAIAGGYMSPLFSGATSLVGPSHYVAHNSAVTRDAGGLPVKVCHPVMDAARVLKAAESCGTVGGGANLSMELPRGITGARGYPQAEMGGGGSGSSDDDLLRPATFIMVGQLATCKTPGMFVRAMAVLQRRRRQNDGKEQGKRRIEGVVAGKGPLRDHMEALARGLNASVSFKGFISVNDVPCEVQRATALVVPSISGETFGMVGPEAMLLGVPLVTFGFGGTGELVRHMENGMVVAEPTPRALADALEVLANDSGLRDRLGAQARLDAARALSLPEMVACHADELHTN